MRRASPRSSPTRATRRARRTSQRGSSGSRRRSRTCSSPRPPARSSASSRSTSSRASRRTSGSPGSWPSSSTPACGSGGSGSGSWRTRNGSRPVTAPHSWRSPPATIDPRPASCSSRWATTRAWRRTCASDPDPGAGGAHPGARVTSPRLRRRDEVATLLDLPWEQPLADWSEDGGRFRELPVGPSRHLVRFMVSDGIVYALKELPAAVALREYEVLRHLEDASLPGVRAVGLAERPVRGDSILLTEYLRHSMQYRRLLMRLRVITPAYRDRLLDAMAWLLVDLHRGGVFWGDCSLANTLFRRDGDRIQAFLVDAETSEVHPSLSDGQRRYDLEILVENVGYGLADVAMLQDRPEDLDAAVTDAESVRDRYLAIWRQLHAEPALPAGDRQAIRSQLRRLNELGFAVDEIEVLPADGGSTVRLRVTTSNRAFHANELRRLTGLRTLEGQARLLLNDLREYRA